MLVPNSKPHRYLMTAFTLSDDLKRKWLFDTAARESKTTDDGDLVKAEKLARMVRIHDPDAELERTEHLRSWVPCCRGCSPWTCALRLSDPRNSDDQDLSTIRQTMVRWFPTDEDIFAQFSAAEEWDAPSGLFRMERVFDDFVGLGETPSRFFQLLEAWVKLAPSAKRRDVALAALQTRGDGADLERLRSSFEALNLETHDDLVENVTYIVHRRTLE